jgi:hypothetical protein
MIWHDSPLSLQNKIWLINKEKKGPGYSSVVECLPGSSISRTAIIIIIDKNLKTKENRISWYYPWPLLTTHSSFIETLSTIKLQSSEYMTSSLVCFAYTIPMLYQEFLSNLSLSASAYLLSPNSGRTDYICELFPEPLLYSSKWYSLTSVEGHFCFSKCLYYGSQSVWSFFPFLLLLD